MNAAIQQQHIWFAKANLPELRRNIVLDCNFYSLVCRRNYDGDNRKHIFEIKNEFGDWVALERAWADCIRWRYAEAI